VGALMLQPLILPPGLGIYQFDPNATVGPRSRMKDRAGPAAVAASTFGVATASIQLPELDNGQAILTEYLSGIVTCDNTGNLQIVQLLLEVVDATPVSLLSIAQPEFTVAFPFGRTGLIFQPPPYLTLFDLKQWNGGTDPTQPLELQLTLGMLNIDSANPHSFSLELDAALRVITGVREG
jgi:hypothetical protein